MTIPHFRTPVAPSAPALALPLASQHLLLGSCFATALGGRLAAAGLPALVNPFGVLYHPHALLHHLERMLHPFPYEAADLVAHEGMWVSLHHHGSFAGPDPEPVLARMNEALAGAAACLARTRLLCLTLGTAWGYWHREREVWAANCHRLPASQFERRLTPADHLLAAADPVFRHLREQHPDLIVAVTVSPVRHLRDAPAENSLSKAHLTILAHGLCQHHANCRYFPASEMLLDDLRDYRFYADDLVHPNALAIDYIWGQFTEWALAPEAADYLAKAADLARRLAHRPRSPDSPASRRLAEENANLLTSFRQRYPFASLPNYASPAAQEPS